MTEGVFFCLIQKQPRLAHSNMSIAVKLRWGYCDISFRAYLKTRLIKEKTDRCGSCKESFRRRAFALQGRLTQQMSCIAVFSQKGFLEMPLNLWYTEIKYIEIITAKNTSVARCSPFQVHRKLITCKGNKLGICRTACKIFHITAEKFI